MAKVTVVKEKNYTTIDNGIFKDTRISFKAKGLLTTMLSLPPTWNYTIEGLATLSKDGRDSIKTALKELENFGYLERKQVRNDNGSFCDLEYFVYEKPQPKEPLAENPPADKPLAENHRQLNTNISNTDVLKTKEEYMDYSYEDDELPFKIDNNSEPDGSVFYNSHNSESKDSDLHNSPSCERERRISMSLGSRHKQDNSASLKDMPARAKEMAKGIVCEGEEMFVESVGQCVEYVVGKYREKNQTEHPHLKNETLRKVVETMLSSITILQDGDLENPFNQVFYPLVSYETSWGDRKKVIDEYFETDFRYFAEDSSGKEARVKVDYSLVHFTQGNVLTCIMQKCYIGEEMEWFYNEPVDLMGEHYE